MSNKRKRLVVRTIILLVILTALGFTLFQMFNKEKVVEIGDQAPDFILTDMAGNKVHLKDFRGKGVVLNFWASWCKPCKREMPFINDAYHETKDSDVVILAVNIQESNYAVKQFVDDNNIDFRILLDKKRDVTDKYGIVPIPTTFFIDKNGRVVDKLSTSMPSKQFILDKMSQIQP